MAGESNQIYTAGDSIIIYLGEACTFTVEVRTHLDLWVDQVLSNVRYEKFMKIKVVAIDSIAVLYNPITMNNDEWDGVEPISLTVDDPSSRYADRIPCRHSMIVKGEYTGYVPDESYRHGDAFNLNFVMRGESIHPTPQLRALTKKQLEERDEVLRALTKKQLEERN
jgi:hypothetical protein